MKKKFYILMVALFVALTAMAFVLKLSDAFTFSVIMIGNLVVFALSILSYAISGKFATSQNNGQFVRGVMGGTFLKFFLALIAGVVYIVLNRESIKIGDILGLMLIYIIYTTIETVFLAKSSRTFQPQSKTTER
jgi:hypothetical protein